MRTKRGWEEEDQGKEEIWQRVPKLWLLTVRVVRLLLLLPLMLHFFHHHHHHHPRTFIERLLCAGHCAGRGAGAERVRGLRVGRSRGPCPYSRFGGGWGGMGTDHRK